MEYKLQADPLRHYNKSLFLQNQDHPQNYKQMSFYKIPCADCPWSYIGETGRCLQTRKKQHIRNTKTFKKGSNIASHAWLNDHSINFDNARVSDKGNFRVRKTLESWHTAITNHADNNAKQLLRQYSILF